MVPQTLSFYWCPLDEEKKKREKEGLASNGGWFSSIFEKTKKDLTVDELEEATLITHISLPLPFFKSLHYLIHKLILT